MSWIDEIEEKYIKTNGIKLHTIIIGKGEPLLLLHGFPDFWYGWKNVIPGLKDHYRLIIPDMRGYNLSDKPLGIENYTVDILINDIKGIIENLGYKSVYLAGHDWGGAVVWPFAERYPLLVKKLAIINAPHMKIFQKNLQNNKEQQKASFYIFEFLKPNGEQFVIKDDFKWLKWAVFSGLEHKKDFTEDDKQKYINAWSQPNAIVSGVNYYRANISFKKWSGIITVPTLVIHGMKDVAVLPSVLDGLENYVKDLEIVRAEKSSHWVMHDEPDLVVNQFKRFFKN
ncbi:MAG: alpha/beta hydrolase [Candidatus Lokiarchaeota archaeon]|nr:alpha/beta hydrolase [Candidatus Lokiarchaeota archaeon]